MKHARPERADPAIDLNEFARRVLARKAYLKLNLEQLAKRGAPPPSKFSKIVNRKIDPAMSTIKRIARALRVPVSELVVMKPKEQEGTADVVPTPEQLDVRPPAR